MVSHLLLHIAKTQEQFQQPRPLLRRAVVVRPRQQLDREIALRHQPIVHLRLKVRALLAHSQRRCGLAERFLKVVRETNALRLQCGRDSFGAGIDSTNAVRRRQRTPPEEQSVVWSTRRTTAIAVQLIVAAEVSWFSFGNRELGKMRWVEITPFEKRS